MPRMQAEVSAVASIAEKGVQLIATAHADTLQTILNSSRRREHLKEDNAHALTRDNLLNLRKCVLKVVATLERLGTNMVPAGLGSGRHRRVRRGAVQGG